MKFSKNTSNIVNNVDQPAKNSTNEHKEKVKAKNSTIQGLKKEKKLELKKDDEEKKLAKIFNDEPKPSIELEEEDQQYREESAQESSVMVDEKNLMNLNESNIEQGTSPKKSQKNNSFGTESFEFNKFDEQIHNQIYMSKCKELRMNLSNQKEILKYQDFCLDKKHLEDKNYPFRMIFTQPDKAEDKDTLKTIGFKKQLAQNFYVNNLLNKGLFVQGSADLLPIATYISKKMTNKRNLNGVASNLVNFMCDHSAFVLPSRRAFFNHIKVKQFLVKDKNQNLNDDCDSYNNEMPYFYWSDTAERYACFPDLKFEDLQTPQNSIQTHTFQVTAKVLRISTLQPQRNIGNQASYNTIAVSLKFQFNVYVQNNKLVSIKYFDSDLEVYGPDQFFKRPVMPLSAAELVIFMLELSWIQCAVPKITEGVDFKHDEFGQIQQPKRQREEIVSSANEDSFVLSKRRQIV